ncbi:hypothetical protein [Comamonas odontotermitis]|uniref:hypothetical protein n=1 Tax=Comamonas odontotermitis TaxID=379895 RepID=UPI001CC64BC5|nr:hypothetical protein [Comamonas odontotermitis]UBB16147.1 hypothetical protein LAD35_15135 [Comamonas odontotermitis]
MQTLSYQFLCDAHPRHIIIDPEGERCKGCGALLKPGPEHCEYCNRPAVSDLLQEYLE